MFKLSSINPFKLFSHKPLQPRNKLVRHKVNIREKQDVIDKVIKNLNENETDTFVKRSNSNKDQEPQLFSLVLDE